MQSMPPAMNGYDELQEYIRAKDPEPRERASLWQTAIGLQKVDGLEVSEFLINTAKKHIEGEIAIDTAQQLIGSYYQTAERRHKIEYDREADTASVNIVKILAEPSFTFSVEGLASIHRRIFQGVFAHAGKFRDYDFSKKEWVLNGASVIYGPAFDLIRTLQYDLDAEKNFKYRGLQVEEVIEHIAEFISGIWQIHPFCEGNTRTTAVFTIKYLRSLGYTVENEMFRDHSWYFRNALVRANYRNIKMGIDYNSNFLVLFLRNLLLDETNELKNRYTHIDWGYTDNSNSQETSQKNIETSQETSQKLAGTSTERVITLLLSTPEITLQEIAERIGLTRRAVQNITNKLKASGKLRREGSTKKGKWIVEH